MSASANSAIEAGGIKPATQWQHDDADQLVNQFKHQIKGKTIVITGVSPHSIGEQFVKSVSAASPAIILLLSTSKTRMTAAIENAKLSAGAAADSIKYLTVEMNLSSQASVRKAAQEVINLVPKIDVLLLNAGIMAVPYSNTDDGIESHFGINHIGHFLLGNLLLEKVRAAGVGARIIVTSSDAHLLTPVVFDDLTWGNGTKYEKFGAYGSSKSANALYAFELARRLKDSQIYVYSVQPGYVLSGKVDEKGHAEGGIIRSLTPEDFAFLGVTIVDNKAVVDPTREQPKTLVQGAATHVFGAFAPGIEQASGKYLRHAAVADKDVASWAQDSEAAKKLWSVSEDLVGQKFEF